MLGSLIAREIAGIAMLEAAVEREPRPDYVTFFHHLKTAKQSSVEQLITILRMERQTLPKRSGARVALDEIDTLGVLTTLHAAEREMQNRYAAAIEQVEGVARQAIGKAHGRVVIAITVLGAHIAKRSHVKNEAADLPLPLDQYFARDDARACMRCLLDRPGTRGPLERVDPRPYTYICAGCHDDAVAELPPDLASEVERWPESARQARVIQHALGRPSGLTAMQTVLHRLSGLPEDPPARGSTKSQTADLPSASPDDSATAVHVDVAGVAPAEEDYVAQLFDYRSVSDCW